MPTDPRIDAYIAGKAAFARPILAHLRARIHAVCPHVEETIKWGMPAFMVGGRLFANMAAFKAHASFGFWDRNALLSTKESEALAARDREGMGVYGRLESLADLPGQDALDAQIREAVARIESGGRPKRAAKPPKPEVPPARIRHGTAPRRAARHGGGWSARPRPAGGPESAPGPAARGADRSRGNASGPQ